MNDSTARLTPEEVRALTRPVFPVDLLEHPLWIAASKETRAAAIALAWERELLGARLRVRESLRRATW